MALAPFGTDGAEGPGPARPTGAAPDTDHGRTHMMPRWTVRRAPGALAAAVGLCAALAPSPGRAQAPDFLFRVPNVTLGIRGGYAVATASGGIFEFTREQLTVGRTDFSAPSFGAQLAIRVTPRTDVAFDLGVANAVARSEFRDWVDNDDLPIEQETEFYRLPLTLGIKTYLRDRGRSVGRFAWIPARWAPFVGAGAGWVWYRFEQEGDWVDFETLDVFSDRFTSRGHTPTVHLYGGADWSLGPAVLLTAEARYAWARSEMGGDFVGFEAMDLSGVQASVGIAVRF